MLCDVYIIYHVLECALELGAEMVRVRRGQGKLTQEEQKISGPSLIIEIERQLAS